MKFTSDVFGTITAIRFYKASANTGTHIGSLWTATGQLLASVTFTNETASGLAAGDLLNPGHDHAQHHLRRLATSRPTATTPRPTTTSTAQPAPTPIGGGTIDNAPLHAVLQQHQRQRRLRLRRRQPRSRPAPTTRDNYWVDVQFSPSPAPGQVTGRRTPLPATASAYVTWTAPSTGGPATSYTVTPYLGGVAQTPTTVNGSPPPTGATVTGLTNGTLYTFTVTATNPTATGPVVAPSNAVTPSAAIDRRRSCSRSPPTAGRPASR